MLPLGEVVALIVPQKPGIWMKQAFPLPFCSVLEKAEFTGENWTKEPTGKKIKSMWICDFTGMVQ